MKYSSIIFGLLLSTQVVAQKYKDLYPELANATEGETLSMLKSYIVTDLDHPNANLKLAEIYERRYKKCDPITEYAKAMANATEAKVRFTKSAAVVNEKEVKKNTGYYADYAGSYDSKGRPIVDFNVVNQKIRSGYDSAKTFTEVVPGIYENFTKSVDFHDRAIKNYNALNGQFNSRDKLLLLYNTTVENQLEKLIRDYDSSLFYLDKYLETGKSYDPTHFDQTYEVKNIDTYRLEGLLTSPNFLIDKITIWDYKKWATEIVDEVSSEVEPLRTEIQKTELEMDAAIKKTNPLISLDNFSPYKLDNKLLFNLTKYDSRSLPLSLLKYKQQKQRLNYQLGLVNGRDTTTSDDVYLIQLGELLYKSKAADSSLNIVETRATQENIIKYEDYFRTHYQGLSGVNSMIKDERMMIEGAADKAVGNIFKTLNKSEEKHTEFLTYNRIKISLIPKPYHLDSITTEPYTTHVQENADGTLYISGLVKIEEDIALFLTKSEGTEKVLWHKTYTLSDDSEGRAVHEPGAMAITPEGCGIMARVRTDKGLSNKLLYLNESGEEIFNKDIDLPLYPREMKYVERTNSFVMIYKGVTKNVDYKDNSDANILNINILGDILWSQQLAYSGDVVDILVLDNGFMLVGNYSAIKDENGKTYNTKINLGDLNGFAARFDPSGQVVSVMPFSDADSYRISEVYKINDKVINLLGFRGSATEISDEKIHIITNQGTQLMYSSL